MLRIVLIDKLREAQGAGHTTWASADDGDVGFHYRMLNAGNGLAKDDHRISQSLNLDSRTGLR